MPTPRFCLRAASHVGLFAAFAGALVYLWSMLCVFPAHSWNAVRLAPSFMLRFGPTPYPGVAEGPLTTWIYGPVPLFLQWPTTFAGDAVNALLAAAVINYAVLLLPLIVAIRIGSKTQMLALLIAIMLVPASCWQFWQSDNAAIAFGLLANVGLLANTTRSTVLAALFTALAVWSKQTELPLVLAQASWLVWTRGRGPAGRYLALCAGFGLTLGVCFALWFGPERFWFNLVTLPGLTPFAPLVNKLHDLGPEFLIYALLPLLLAWKFKAAIRTSPSLTLGAVSFLILLPFSIISFFKIGGSVNSLHPALYLLPGAAVGMSEWLAKKSTFASLATVGVVVVLCIFKAGPGLGILQPQTKALKQGAYLAESLHDSIYMPWNPLITYFTDHRFYHAEDGLGTRLAAGFVFTPASLRAHLPDKLSVVAYAREDPPGFITSMLPARARHDRFGEWDLYSWELAPTKP